MSQSSNVGFAEGDASLLSDAVIPCIKLLVRSHNSMSSAVVCFYSFSSISLRTAERLVSKIFSELFKEYTVRKHG